MKVLLTHGYFINEDGKEQNIMRPYPPLGLLYISSYLNLKNISNSVFDTTFKSKKELFEYIEKEQPKVIGLYVNLMTKLNVLEIIKFIKSHDINSKVILGGPDVTYNTLDYLDNGADFIVIGEGEQTFEELSSAIINHESDFSHIDGIAYLDSLKNEVRTSPRTKIKSIDELPIPNRKAIDISKYMDTWKKYHGASSINVSTQRGCPYTCKWCSTAVYGQSYRRRSPKLLVEELKEIQELYNPDSIWFVDDVFTVSHKWLREFVAELKKENLEIKFECISRAERMNEEVIELLKRAGCAKVWIGAESGSQNVIDAMDRRVSVETVRNTIIATKKAGIETGTFIMVGYPGETQKDIYETIHHLKVSNPDHFTITVAYPIKGTSLYNEIEKLQIKELDWAKTTDRDRDFKRTYKRRYYDFATAKVIHEMAFFKSKEASGWSWPTLKFKVKSTLSGIGMMVHKLN